MRVLAIDSGWGSGWATYETTTGEFESGEVWTFAGACDQILYLLADPAILEVVAEQYIITARTAQLSQQTEALRILGVLEHECRNRALVYATQAPKSPDKKQVVQRLKALGWFIKTPDHHANSAANHLYSYCASHNYLTEEDRLKLIRLMEA